MGNLAFPAEYHSKTFWLSEIPVDLAVGATHSTEVSAKDPVSGDPVAVRVDVRHHPGKGHLPKPVEGQDPGIEWLNSHERGGGDWWGATFFVNGQQVLEPIGPWQIDRASLAGSLAFRFSMTWAWWKELAPAAPIPAVGATDDGDDAGGNDA